MSEEVRRGGRGVASGGGRLSRHGRSHVSLHTRLFYFKALLWESIIFLLSPSTSKAYPIALHDHCAIYAPSPPPPFHAIHHTILVMGISCTG